MGEIIPFTESVVTINDLDVAIKGSIKFLPWGNIFLAGFNTAHEQDKFAFELAKVAKIALIGSSDKIDLFNVQNKR